MADDKQERGKAIEVALAQIEKQFGKGSIMRLGSARMRSSRSRDPDGVALARLRRSAWAGCPAAA